MCCKCCLKTHWLRHAAYIVYCIACVFIYWHPACKSIDFTSCFQFHWISWFCRCCSLVYILSLPKLCFSIFIIELNCILSLCSLDYWFFITWIYIADVYSPYSTIFRYITCSRTFICYKLLILINILLI